VDNWIERISWRRRPAGGFATHSYQKNRRLDAGATKSDSMVFGKMRLDRTSAAQFYCSKE
jgi:hypothetical protein